MIISFCLVPDFSAFVTSKHKTVWWSFSAALFSPQRPSPLDSEGTCAETVVNIFFQKVTLTSQISCILYVVHFHIYLPLYRDHFKLRLFPCGKGFPWFVQLLQWLCAVVLSSCSQFFSLLISLIALFSLQRLMEYWGREDLPWKCFKPCYQ